MREFRKGGGRGNNFIRFMLGGHSQNVFFFPGTQMGAEHTLTISTAFFTATLTTPSGWVVLGVVGAVCATVAAVAVVVESGRRERERKHN